ncbi:MAG TPA: CHAT domain-containing protein [Candidatus Omnitrophota bacterium]|nr:CHAT domain-containing protein [Candidatus Omnitrophota bacterium]HRZ14170.1 CHAT domain-containing protein [Candidatus Omnitrophota bacterium]
MKRDIPPLVFEIIRQDNILKMSAFEQSEAATLTIKRYSQCKVAFPEIETLCLEVADVLSKSNRRDMLDEGLLGRLKKSGQMLWEQLLSRSIKEKFRNSPGRDLVLFLDEELVQIPWELLYDGAEFLCLKFNTGRLLRARHEENIPRYRSSSGKLKMLILANPTADLAAAYREGIAIKNRFDSRRDQLSIDFKSTSIDTLYVKKNLREYDIVHFAGHCEFDREHPEATGWVLSDGRLTTGDILNMAESIVFPSLVFSNACQSARVEGTTIDPDYQQKNYSLASAFLFSGVRHYIGALQRVEDPVSLVFARQFYACLSKSLSVGEAMRLSRLKLIHEYGKHSIFWANHLLYGDPSFVLLRKAGAVVPAVRQTPLALFERQRRRIIRGALVAAIAVACVAVYGSIAAVHPGAWFAVQRTKSLLARGENERAAVAALKLIRAQPSYLAAYPLAAEARVRSGDRIQAIRYYYEYAMLSIRAGAFANVSSAYTMIGWLYQQQGAYDRALEFYTKSLDLSRQHHDRLNESGVLRKLAVWHMDKGENDKALELLTKSSEINRQRPQQYAYQYNLACDYFDMGLVFTNKGDLAAAKEFYIKSQEIFNRLNKKEELSDYYFNLGEIALQEKDYARALDYYTRGLNIDLQQHNQPAMVVDYSMIGELYMEIEDPLKAEEFFQQALTIASRIDARLESAAVYYDLGLLAKKRGQKNKAREFLRRAQEIYKSAGFPEEATVKDLLLSLDNN